MTDVKDGSTALAVPASGVPAKYFGLTYEEVAALPKPPETAPCTPEEWQELSAEDRVALLKTLAVFDEDTTRGLTIGIPRLKYPTSGTVFWDVPGADAGVKTLNFVILKKSENRVFYPPSDEPPKTGELPTCMSEDKITADPESIQVQSPTGKCEDCQWSRWKSGKGGEGQACKVRVRLYIAMQNQIGADKVIEPIPTFISLPPTAIKPFGDYASGMKKGRRQLQAYVTNFGLVKATNKGGTEYAKLVPSCGEKLGVKDFLKVTKMIEEYGPLMEWRGAKAMGEEFAADAHQHQGDVDADGIPNFPGSDIL